MDKCDKSIKIVKWYRKIVMFKQWVDYYEYEVMLTYDTPNNNFELLCTLFYYFIPIQSEL